MYLLFTTLTTAGALNAYHLLGHILSARTEDSVAVLLDVSSAKVYVAKTPEIPDALVYGLADKWTKQLQNKNSTVDSEAFVYQLCHNWWQEVDEAGSAEAAGAAAGAAAAGAIELPKATPSATHSAYITKLMRNTMSIVALWTVTMEICRWILLYRFSRYQRIK